MSTPKPELVDHCDLCPFEGCVACPYAGPAGRLHEEPPRRANVRGRDQTGSEPDMPIVPTPPANRET